MDLAALKNDLREKATEERAKNALWFFKTGKGEYGEGDVFIGISNPDLRAVCKHYKHLDFDDLQDLLDDKIHEFRFAALIIMVEQYKKANAEKRKQLFDFYLKNLHNINNWDLVDCSCRDIVGFYLYDKDRSLLDEMAEIDHLWTQRVAIISTSYFIGKGEFGDTLRISKSLLHHKHDLIHKAVGWMLRECWKRGGQAIVEQFLTENIQQIPRTALRYSIEKMSEEQRKYFLALR